MTLQEHRSLRAIQENRQVIVHERDRATKGYYPRVDVTGAAGWSQNSDNTTRNLGHGADTNFYPGSRISATMSQMVWDGHATRAKVRETEATLNSMSARVLDNANTLALDAILAHFNMVRTNEILTLAEENLRRHQSLLNLVLDRQRTGADSLADVSQAKSRFARAQTQAADAKAALLAAEANYFRLTNQRISATGVTPPAAPDFIYSNAGSIFEDAHLHNPKLAALMADIQIGVAGRELNKAAYQPTFSIEAGPSYMTKGVGGKGEEWTHGVDVMLVMRWNIFNSGADRDAVAASEARIRQSRQTLYSFDDDLKNAIDLSWIERETAILQAEFYADASRYSRETLKAYNEQFLLGQRSILDVLDAESELYNNSVQSVTANHNIPVSEYRLLALGGVLLPGFGITDKQLLEILPADNGPAYTPAR